MSRQIPFASPGYPGGKPTLLDKYQTHLKEIRPMLSGQRQPKLFQEVVDVFFCFHEPAIISLPIGCVFLKIPRNEKTVREREGILSKNEEKEIIEKKT